MAVSENVVRCSMTSNNCIYLSMVIPMLNTYNEYVDAYSILNLTFVPQFCAIG